MVTANWQAQYKKLLERAPSDDVRSAISYLIDYATKKGFDCEPHIPSKPSNKHSVEYRKGNTNPYSFIVNKKKGLKFYLKNEGNKISEKLREYLKSESKFEFDPNPNSAEESNLVINSQEDAEEIMAAIFNQSYRIQY